MAPRTNTDLENAQKETQSQIAKLSQAVQLLLQQQALAQAPGANQLKRIPLRQAQLKKTMTQWSLYTSKHDTIEHDKPVGLRLTLVDDVYVVVESPPHAKDARERVHFMVPIQDFFWIEPSVQHPQRSTPDEMLALMRAAVDRKNYLASIEPPPPSTKTELQLAAAHMRDEAARKRAEAKAAEEVEAGEPAPLGRDMTDEERAADEAADEAATLAEMKDDE